MALQDEINKALTPQKTGVDVAVGCFMSLFVIVVGFFITFYGAWVLTHLWTWFAVPAGLPAITIKTALGIMLIVSFLTWQMAKMEEPKEGADKPTYTAFYRQILRTLFYTVGYLMGMFWNWWL